MMGRRAWVLATTLALCASALTGLTGCDNRAGSTPGFKSVDITGVDYANQLSLPDVDGRLRTLADFKGKVVFVFFGYVHCPDVCPTTMGELAQVKKQLGPDGERVQGIFVTVDPQRDTPELLKSYMGAFDPGFIALRGTPQQTEAAARGFRVFYQQVPGRQPGEYTVDHTAGAYVFDPQGRVRLFVRYGLPPADLAADLKSLLAGA